MNNNFNVPLTSTGIAGGISTYSKIADTIADKVVSSIKHHEKDGDNVFISSESYIKAEQSGIISENSEEVISETSEYDSKTDEPETETDDVKQENTEDDLSENSDEQSDVKKAPLSNNEVTQHTANLWKYQPVNNNEPENAEEYMTKKVIMNNAEIIGASVRGKKHKHDGTNRDDCFEISYADNIAVIAVSDGAGSKKFSRIGAKVSCESAVESAVKLIENLKSSDNYNQCMANISSELNSDSFMRGCGVFADIIQESVISACNAVEEAFNDRKSKYNYLKVIERDMELKDFSATLLLTIIVPLEIDGVNQLFVISCQIGDGMISAISNNLAYNDALKLLGEADSGQFAGETDFITSSAMKYKEKLMGRTKIARREISDVLIMTDGVADDYYPNSPQLARLYMDLQLNGIIPVSHISENVSESDIISKIPEPDAYPWVNDNSVEIPVNYSSQIAEKCGITYELLWESSDIIENALSKLGENNESSEEKLKIWLDNYVERGSFDDRTLVIYSARHNHEKAEVLNNEQTG